ncbi:MAG: prolipoprotein diacylglyceryl transferase [Clostridia bacterium]|nr:prolipoprotein diacylglyceryl transferase [Clostridia bacterium]
MSPGPYIVGIIRWYSVLIVAGMAIAVWLACREEKRVGLPKDTILDLALLLLPMGIIGARLYYVAFKWEEYAVDPLSILYIWNGGLAIYGGIIGGTLAALIYAWRHKLSLAKLADVIIPGVVLAQGIGRWGNFFNSEAYGIATPNAFWQFFPASVRIGDTWHLATFFYESLLDVAIFAWLWAYRKYRRHSGDTLLAYLLLYGAGRMFIEGLRTDSLYIGGTLRVSQALSALMVLAACIVWASRVRKWTRLVLVLPCASLAAVIWSGTSEINLSLFNWTVALYGILSIVTVLYFEQKEAADHAVGQAEQRAVPDAAAPGALSAKPDAAPDGGTALGEPSRVLPPAPETPRAGGLPPAEGQEPDRVRADLPDKPEPEDLPSGDPVQGGIADEDGDSRLPDAPVGCGEAEPGDNTGGDPAGSGESAPEGDASPSDEPYVGAEGYPADRQNAAGRQALSGSAHRSRVRHLRARRDLRLLQSGLRTPGMRRGSRYRTERR